MDARGKLVELLMQVEDNMCDDCGREPVGCAVVAVADHLIAHGVTVQECGHWVSHQSDEPYGCRDEKEWYKCSKCGKDAYGRCYEDEWYSAPILSDYCPHCGAKMMPQPPKGE